MEQRRFAVPRSCAQPCSRSNLLPAMRRGFRGANALLNSSWKKVSVAGW